MQKLIIPIALLLLSYTSFGQSYKITWGDEIKLKKGTSDLDILFADKSGLFFTEKRMVTGFTIGGSRSSYKLYKFDKNYEEVFDKEYKKELKGLSFEGFQELENELYLFASDYIKKERTFKIYGAKVDKNSGDLTSDFNELGSYELENKRDDYDMKVSPVKNGKAFVLVSNISASDRVSLAVSLLDKSLKKKESTVINLAFQKDFYSLEDVQFTSNNKIILLGKEFEEIQVGKKKRKKLVFKQYVMGIYDTDGKKLNDIKMDADDRYIISGKLIEQPDGQLLLAGFYSKNAKKDDLNGFFINKINADNGTLTLSSFKEINAAMLGNAYQDENDEDEETKESKKQAKKAKDDDEEDEFPNSFIIKSVDINPADNSIIISSEVSRYSVSTYTTSSYNPTTRTTTWRTVTTHRFTNQDILLINADKDGNIKWLNALPKSQVEQISTSSSRGIGFSVSYDYSGYFARGGGMPYYSSYKSFINGNSLVLILNDHNSNNVNPAYGDKVKTVYNFRKKSTAYGVAVDLATGKMVRKPIVSNNEETILMPRHGYVMGNEILIPSWRQKALAKTELQFAKITVK
jgi:hypothetical protein